MRRIVPLSSPGAGHPEAFTVLCAGVDILGDFGTQNRMIRSTGRMHGGMTRVECGMWSCWSDVHGSPKGMNFQA